MNYRNALILSNSKFCYVADDEIVLLLLLTIATIIKDFIFLAMTRSLSSEISAVEKETNKNQFKRVFAMA